MLIWNGNSVQEFFQKFYTNIFSIIQAILRDGAFKTRKLSQRKAQKN